MDKHNRPARDKLLSFSLMLIAGSICYFSYSLLSVSKQIPAILDQVSVVSKQIDRTTQNIEPLLAAVPGVLETIPSILQTVDKTTDSIQPILDESGKIRAVIPSVLGEVEAVRNSLPSILSRVDSLQQQVTQLQKEIPVILKSVDGVTGAVHETNQRVDKIVPLVPMVLDEVKTTRAEIPTYLTRVENIVANSKGISEAAGKGAVTGFFKGIVATPFELLKGTEDRLRSSLKNERLLTDEDFELVYQASTQLLQDENQKTQSWRNPRTGNEGKLTILNSYRYSGEDCKTIQMWFKTKNGSEDTTNKDICQNSEGQWKPVD